MMQRREKTKPGEKDIVAVFNEVNQLRKQRGLPPLTMKDMTLDKILAEKEHLLSLANQN